MQDKVFLCLDFGTESVRGELINPIGESLGSSAFPYKTYYPYSGWAEQNPRELWESMLIVCQSLVKTAKLKQVLIESICIDSTACSLIFLNEKKEVQGNLILWMDTRAKELKNKLGKYSNSSTNLHIGQNIPPSWMPARIKWLLDQNSEIYKNSVYVCELLDWLQYKFTGKLVHSKNILTLKWYYNSSGAGWPVEFFKEIGIDSILDKVSPNVLAPGEKVGSVKKDIANEIGFIGYPLVVEGGADAFIGTLGLNVVNEGDVALIGGSSHVLLCYTEKNIHEKGLFGTFKSPVIPKRNILEGSQTSSGATLNWFVKNFISDQEKDFRFLDKKANKIPIGSEGVIVLDHWQGNRSPFMTAKSSGVIRGLTLSHTPIHVYRAILEGVALGTSVIVDTLIKTNYEIKKIVIGGGIVKSPLWLQIHSDTLGMPLYPSSTTNAQLLGCAVLSAYACGYYNSIIEASRKMQKPSHPVEPNLSCKQKYDEIKDTYLETYHNLFQ